MRFPVLRTSLLVFVIGSLMANLGPPTLKSSPIPLWQLAEPPRASSPDADSTSIGKAKQFLQEGKKAEAIALLRVTLRDHPTDGDAHLLLGIALSDIPRREEALTELRRAVELEPRSAVAAFTLGNALAHFAESDAAGQALERAVALDPDFVPARISLALVLAQQKQLDSARKNLESAIHLLGSVPAAAYPHYLMAQALTRQNRLQQALEELNSAVSLRPDYAEAYLRIGMLKKSLQDDAGAIQAFRKAAELSPTDAETLYQLGGAYFRSGDAAAATKPLSRVVELRPADRQARYQLCQAFRMSGRKQEASECQEKLAVLVHDELAHRDNEVAAGELNNEGIQLEKAGNVPAAIDKYQAAVKLTPSNPVFRRNLALALCRLGRWKEGISDLREVLRQYPGDPEATKALYIALDHTSKTKGADPAAEEKMLKPN